MVRLNTSRMTVRRLSAVLIAALLVAAVWVPLASVPAEAAETPLYAPFPEGVKYRVSQGFDGKKHAATKNSQKGLDFDTGNGKVVAASAPGTVRDRNADCANQNSGCNGGKGNFVEVQHPDGRCTMYMHLSRVDVKKGDKISQAATLGLTGTSGQSSGAHLHFHVTKCGSLKSQPFKLVEYSGSYANKDIVNKTITSKNKAARVTITIDEPNLHGDAKWWNRVTSTANGHGKDYWWTLSAGSKYTKDVVYAVWQTAESLSGKYEVQCYVPNNSKDTSSHALYLVTHQSKTSEFLRSQPSFTGKWISFGTHTFKGAGKVRLGDRTGQNDYNKRIGVDACRWIPR